MPSLEVPGGLVFKDLGLSLTVVVPITAVAWVRSLARELPHAVGVAKNKSQVYYCTDALLGLLLWLWLWLWCRLAAAAPI